MKTGVVVAIVIGVFAVLYLAISKGLIKSGVPGAGGIVAPQPASNYSGYLAATTAPQVSGILQTILTGVNSATMSWFNNKGPSTAAPAQGASASSPSLFAAPSGPIQTPADTGMGWMIGPQLDAGTTYDATPGSAFDFQGLAADNAYDPSASLEV